MQVTAGILDFPRKTLPKEIWKYEEGQSLPRLQPALRSAILSEARYKLSQFGAELIGAMLYGGAATYQYHKGADIDVSLYIDWDTFNGDPEVLESTFKAVEIPWGDYVLHLFVKPASQKKQVEVADASYNVLKDEWVFPPLILPKDFDPELYFAPLIDMAEKKAKKFDELMGKIGREWNKLKKAVKAREEDARDQETVQRRIDMQKILLNQYITRLIEDFDAAWIDRDIMHQELRKQVMLNGRIDQFARFQPPEVIWKYLDESGYVEFLKILSKAHEDGVLQELMDLI